MDQLANILMTAKTTAAEAELQVIVAIVYHRGLLIFIMAATACSLQTYVCALCRARRVEKEQGHGCSLEMQS
jgi:hypothetical protein